jgi:hypothetical protein
MNLVGLERFWRSAQYGRITLWRAHKVARRGDWFRASIDELLGDAAQAVFPLGRIILHYDDRAPDAGPLISNPLRP